MSGWRASLHASNQNSPEIFQLVKKGKSPKKPAKSSALRAHAAQYWSNGKRQSPRRSCRGLQIMED